MFWPMQEERSAKIIKDVMEETIAQVYIDMKESQTLLTECLHERLERQALLLSTEMAERDFSMRLHGMYIHAQNRLAAAEEYVTEESQSVPFAANTVEEGLRGCYDIKELTQLVGRKSFMKAMEEAGVKEGRQTKTPKHADVGNTA